jgi:hypothetical protein
MEEVMISPVEHDPQGQVKQQQAAGVGILLQIMMLVLSFVLGHVLRRHRFHYLPEASGSLLIGLIVGILANISDTETSIRFCPPPSIPEFSLLSFPRSLVCSFYSVSGRGLISTKSSSSCFCCLPSYYILCFNICISSFKFAAAMLCIMDVIFLDIIHLFEPSQVSVFNL